jgi:hypothetical protein
MPSTALPFQFAAQSTEAEWRADRQSFEDALGCAVIDPLSLFGMIRRLARSARKLDA